MRTKKQPGLEAWGDPDEAPILTKEMLEHAEIWHGDKFVRRARGRPPLGATKEQINIRLDADVMAKLRERGPGWQTRVNEILREVLLPEIGPTKNP